jgi:hypothetical protein
LPSVRAILCDWTERMTCTTGEERDKANVNNVPRMCVSVEDHALGDGEADTTKQGLQVLKESSIDHRRLLTTPWEA